jgi:glycosyltransferase involved in cell wall biosynthesis
MSQCDLFIFPSHTEGFPNAVLEAMALGRPILATAVGAIPEMLDGNRGFMVEPQNVSNLTAALECICSNSNMRAEMGHLARAHAFENYSVEHIFKKYMSHWRTVKDAL